MNLRELQKFLHLYKRLDDKILIAITELENIDHDFGKNEVEKERLIKIWKGKQNEVEKVLKQHLVDVELNWL